MASLGKIKKLNVSDMKKIWPNEEKNLSPWIKDNIDALNEILNLQIEIQGQEEHVHNFRLDLVGTDNYSKKPVIIENQFDKSDHDHLGKLITYSAAKEAGIMIWIANEIQTAHRDAIEWLNTITPQDMAFYALELEVFQIDKSLPAPHFRIIAEPPATKRRVINAGGISPRDTLYEKFFSNLRSKLLELAPDFTRAKALPQSWWALGIGRSGFSVVPSFTGENKFRIEIYIDVGNKQSNQKVFDQLKESKKIIEDKIGYELTWDPLPESRACRIYYAIDGTIDDNAQKHNEIIEWATPLMVKFRDAFAPLVKNLEIDL
ncbi:MAG: DUF4268 domain-containing protein [Planctomycetota bacterium]